ncbi:MAG: TonB-dependent receptor [Novosphingobium sp.]
MTTQNTTRSLTIPGVRSHKRALLLAALPALALCTPAQAQDVPEDDAGASGEIVVTAQKRDERLIDVPVSVSVVKSDDLIQQNLVQLRDYYARIPGLSINGGGLEQRASSLILRGVSAGGGTAATVAITLDDVPFTSSSYQAQSPLPDLDPATLQGIEVLRGPQGTLYGASSLGGLIKFVTTAPDATRWKGRIEGGVSFAEGGSEGYSVRGSLNAPIIEDRVALQVSGFFRRDPGYIDNINPLVNTKDINKNKAYGGRAALLVKATDNLTFNLSVLHQRNRFYGSPLIRVCAACDTAPTTSPVRFDPVFGEFTNNLAPSFRSAEFTVYQGRANLDLGFADITSISAWSLIKSESTLDQTTSFGFLLPSYSAPAGSTTPLINGDRTAKFSQEVRISSKAGQAPFDWMLGGFYTKEHTRTTQDLSVMSPTGSSLGRVLASTTPSTYEELAAFADLTYHVTSQFDIQAGVRFSGNKQWSGGSSTIYALAVPFFAPPGTPPGDFVSASAERRFSESSITWLASARYRFTPDMMAYVRVATGYRPGGSNAVLPGIPASFGSDTVTNYELGLKGKIRSADLTYELAAFQVDWNDIQLQFTTPSAIGFFVNGRTARSRGVEFSAGWTPLPGLRIDGNMTVPDAVLTADVLQVAGTNPLPGLKGDRLPGTAKFVGNLAVQKDWDLGNDLNLNVGANYSYVGRRFGQAINPGAPFSGTVIMPAYSLVDFNAGIAKGGWSLNFFVRNLFDERAVIEATSRGGTSRPVAIFAQPRTFGVTAAKSF